MFDIPNEFNFDKLPFFVIELFNKYDFLDFCRADFNFDASVKEFCSLRSLISFIF